MSLHVQRRGTRGPLLIFVHGWGFSGKVWETIMCRLQSTHRCLAVDLPGSGYSTLPDSEYSLPRIARLLSTDLPTGAVWIGWSLGAMVAMQVAIDHPASVASLVLVAGTPRFTRAHDWPWALEAKLLDRFGNDLLQQYEQTLMRFTLLQVRGSTAAKEVARSLRRQLTEVPAPSPEVLVAGLRLLRETDLRAALPAIACPVTVLLGERDTLIPSDVSKDLHTLRPEWTIEILPGAGHAPFLSHPGSFCDRLFGAAHVPA